VTREVALALVTALLPACAGRIPLPKAYEVGGAGELVARMAAARSPLSSYSAEVRITYFGHAGRVRTTGSIALARPASLRYEVMGPQGGVVNAFATNGTELQALDLAASRFVYGPATPRNLDRLLPFVPLGLGPPALVRLFFGEVEVPATATLAYDDRVGRFVLAWSEAGGERRVEVEPSSSRVTRAVVRSRGVVVSDVSIEERDGRGLPVALHVTVPGEKSELEAKLRDVEANPALEPSVFVLDAPSGVATEHL
jgi:outer membrane lipoprotein-sorting protein